MKTTITTAKELSKIAATARERRQAMRDSDTKMCYLTLVEPELLAQANEGHNVAVVSGADIQAYNPRHENLLKDVLALIKANGCGYEVLNSGNVKIIF